MASLGFNFDPTQVEERRGDFQVYPPGRYRVQILQSEIELNKNQNGKNAWFEFEIMDGEFQGGTFPHYINNIIHPTVTAQEIAQRELGELFRACNVIGDNTEVTHFIPIVVNLKFIKAGTVERGGYEHKNDINRIARYEADSGAPVQQQRPVQQPQQQRPIQTQGARPQTTQQPAQQHRRPRKVARFLPTRPGIRLANRA
jgi:Protein of unknown function (DUF669)